MKMLKQLFCKIGWHSSSYKHVGYDGCSDHAECRWCKYKGLVDSQGNLF